MPSLVASTGRVEATSGKIQALQRGLLGREMAPGADRAPVSSVQRFDRVRRAHHTSDLYVVVQERDELFPRGLPQPDDRRVSAAPLLGQVPQGGRSGLRVRGGIDRLHVGFRASQSFFDAHRNVLRIRWMMQVCTVVAGQTFPTCPSNNGDVLDGFGREPAVELVTAL
jgi:hypothetical protein